MVNKLATGALFLLDTPRSRDAEQPLCLGDFVILHLYEICDGFEPRELRCCLHEGERDREPGLE